MIYIDFNLVQIKISGSANSTVFHIIVGILKWCTFRWQNGSRCCRIHVSLKIRRVKVHRQTTLWLSAHLVTLTWLVNTPIRRGPEIPDWQNFPRDETVSTHGLQKYLQTSTHAFCNSQALWLFKHYFFCIVHFRISSCIVHFRIVRAAVIRSASWSCRQKSKRWMCRWLAQNW